MNTPPSEGPPGEVRPGTLPVSEKFPEVPDGPEIDPDDVPTVPAHMYENTGPINETPQQSPPFTATPRLESLLNERTPIDPDLPPMPMDQELAADHAARIAADTPREWRKQLQHIVSKFAKAPSRSSESPKPKAESAERSAKLMAGLKSRLVELGAQAPKGIEGWFRLLGETYNKAGFKTKLATGLALGIGYGVALGTVSLPAAVLLGGGIAAQRIAGLASMYLKYEKEVVLGDERGKQRAMWKAIRNTTLMTGGMVLLSEGVKLAMEHYLAGAAPEVSKMHWTGKVQHIAPTPEHAAAPIAPLSAVPEVLKPEIPHLSVEASPGHGFEYMAKHLWRELQDQHLDPNNFEKGTDIHKLLTADAGSIDRVAHQIAADPTHGFFKPDGTSVRIDLGAHLTIGADGQLHLQTGGADVVRAAADMSTTSAYHPELTPHAAPPPLTPLAPVHEAVTATPVQVAVPPTPPVDVQHASTHTAPSRYVDNPLSNAVHTDAVGNPVLEPSAHPPQGVYQGDGRPHDFGNPLTGSKPEQVTPVASPHLESYVTPPTPAEHVPASAPEASAAPSASAQPEPAVAHTSPEANTPLHLTVNANGLSIDTAHASAYLDAQGNNIIFGGSLEERAQKALEIVAKDHTAVVYFDSTRPNIFGFPVHHLSKAYWFQGSGETLNPNPLLPGSPVEVQQPMVVDDTVDTTLRGVRLPSIDDLKEMYKQK